MYNLCKLYVIDKLLRNRRQYQDTKLNLNYFVKFTEIFSAEMFILLICLLVSGFISSESDENGKAAIPHWENLECQVSKLSMYCTELDVKPCIVL